MQVKKELKKIAIKLPWINSYKFDPHVQRDNLKIEPYTTEKRHARAEYAFFLKCLKKGRKKLMLQSIGVSDCIFIPVNYTYFFEQLVYLSTLRQLRIYDYKNIGHGRTWVSIIRLISNKHLKSLIIKNSFIEGAYTAFLSALKRSGLQFLKIDFGRFLLKKIKIIPQELAQQQVLKTLFKKKSLNTLNWGLIIPVGKLKDSDFGKRTTPLKMFLIQPVLKERWFGFLISNGSAEINGLEYILQAGIFLDGRILNHLSKLLVLRLHEINSFDLLIDGLNQVFAVSPLSYISFCADNITDQLIAHLLLDKAQQLISLSLSQNSITDLGVAYLVQKLKRLSHLTHLGLDRNQLRDQSISFLEPLLTHSLVTLDIKRNEITYKGIDRLSNIIKSHPRLPMKHLVLSLESVLQHQILSGIHSIKVNKKTLKDFSDALKYNYGIEFLDFCYRDKEAVFFTKIYQTIQDKFVCEEVLSFIRKNKFLERNRNIANLLRRYFYLMQYAPYSNLSYSVLFNLFKREGRSYFFEFREEELRSIFDGIYIRARKHQSQTDSRFSLFYKNSKRFNTLVEAANNECSATSCFFR